jgi:hypothetical protein
MFFDPDLTAWRGASDARTNRVSPSSSHYGPGRLIRFPQTIS